MDTPIRNCLQELWLVASHGLVVKFELGAELLYGHLGASQIADHLFHVRIVALRRWRPLAVRA